MKKIILSISFVVLLTKNSFADKFSLNLIDEIRYEEQERIRKEREKIALAKFKSTQRFRDDKKSLAEALFHEARGEGDFGIKLVADVILNRSESNYFKYERKQYNIQKVVSNPEFSYFTDNISNNLPNDYRKNKFLSLAEKYITERKFYKIAPQTRALFYHAKNISYNHFFHLSFPKKYANCYKDRIVGNHVFKEPTCSKLRNL